MKKNSQIHLILETELLESIKQEASNENLSISELCRIKLRKNSRLKKIETMIEDLSKKLNLIAEKNER